MVFDSENAIHLYNFKHDRPGQVFKTAAQPAKPPTMKVGWKDGKTTIETDKALLNISNRIQLRFTEQLPDEHRRARGNGRPRAIRSAPSASAAPSSSSTAGSTRRPCSTSSRSTGPSWAARLGQRARGREPELGHPPATVRFQIKVGQFKVPFGRQELTSSGSSAVRRPLARRPTSSPRAATWACRSGACSLKNKLDWRLGVFNGNGRTKTANDNDKYQINGRWRFQPWGDVKYSESDFESTDKPLLAFAGLRDQRREPIPRQQERSTLLVVNDSRRTARAKTTTAHDLP